MRIPAQKKFVRIGKPDGGKECFWELENGDMYQWQAKFFIGSLGSAQWTQLNESVKSAIDNCPVLTHYTVALPIDRPDGRTKGKSSMLDKWNEKKAQWEKYAASKGQILTIEFWGSHELTLMLSKLENEGLKCFWFNKDEFSDQWFDARNNESIIALGSRYTNNLKVDLEIAEDFAGLSRDKSFEKKYHTLYKKVMEKFRQVNLLDHDELREPFEKLTAVVKHLRDLFEPLVLTGNDLLPLHRLIEYCDEINVQIRQIQVVLYKKSQEKTDTKSPHEAYQSRPFAQEQRSVRELQDTFIDFRDFSQSLSCQLANHPFLILTGKAGMGKSHLLADILTNRRKSGRQSLLFLGENFSTLELPWTQMLKNHLRKNQIDEFTFLGAINAKAESLQSRIIFFIDAINEGEGITVWPRNLKSFIESFKPYPWVGLVVSIRSSYEKLIAPSDKIDHSIAFRLKHTGFEGIEYEAARLFFSHYKIIQPVMPLLNPEFQNPLFLKLFCKSLFDRGQHFVPPGYEGITRIIDYFLESVNYKLSLPEHLYYDEQKNLVQKSVRSIITKIVESGKDYLEYSLCDEIVDSIFNGNCTNKEPFLKRLISEEVFNVDLTWDENGTYSQVIYFAYQRFQDHLKVSLLLDRYLDKENPVISFDSGPLREIVGDPDLWYNQNMIEALSIQLPECINKELFEVAPYAKPNETVADAFIDSLIWRKNDSIGFAAQEYVTEIIANDEELFDRFLDEIISISVKPGHPFNALSLHQRLIQLSLPKRDHLWTTWLQDKYGDEVGPNSIKRIIDWGWNDDDKSHISDESARLAAITLAWCLTSSNRYLRDAATKSLVSLLQTRSNVITEILRMFEVVNDPYVLERLYAVAYGCILRKKWLDNSDALLCKYIYSAIFDKKMIVPHILLRDYARGVLEYSIYKGITLDIDVKKFRPPYQSKPLPKRFPSISTIDRKFKPKRENGNYGKEDWGVAAILNSMTTEYGRGTAQYGDFGRYVFQRAFDDWNVDSDGLSNYAIQRIFELGYDSKLFGLFDGKQGSGRNLGHKERIGKKYQWIALYELLARVSDHYELSDESDWEDKSIIPYDGPWYPYVRDIDPSVLLWQTQSERYTDYTPNWRFNINYVPNGEPHKLWVNYSADLPDVKGIIQVEDPNKQKWLWLELHPDWSESEKLGEDRYNTNRKRLWYQIRSYLVKEEDLEILQIAMQNRTIEEMPEARSLYTVFSREYYWSPAFSFFNRNYYEGEQWSKVYDKKRQHELFKVMRTTEYFNWEEEFDCSKLSPIGFYKPTQFLKQGLLAEHDRKEGEFCDASGEIICLDPSVNNRCISGLLVRQDKLMQFLDKSRLNLVWWVIGEKQILGSNFKKGEYPGRLIINGLYELKDDVLQGTLSSRKYGG